MEYVIRELGSEELPLLEDFLYLSIFVPEGETPPPRDILMKPELRVYLDGFGEGVADLCLVAEAEGRVVGAAWSRIMDDYGHVDDDTPSLAISLLPGCRGLGIGTALLTRLLERLARDGWKRASLSVQNANAAQRLYRRLGFEPVIDRDGEYIMVKPLAAERSHP